MTKDLPSNPGILSVSQEEINKAFKVKTPARIIDGIAVTEEEYQRLAKQNQTNAHTQTKSSV